MDWKEKYQLTEKEIREIIRVCGEDFDEIDIPAYIRKRKRV